jgi:two-component system alkaline phosphatase synthesis response regulator PhoP
MKMAKILIIEDDASILLPLEDNLKLEGYEVASATDGSQGLAMAREGHYDLIILDIMLPKLNGLEVCRQLRQDKNTTPILMLTAKSQEVDKVLGLELGADDYVTKPFSPRELLARLKAILRRTHQIQQGIDFYRFGDVEVDFKKYEAKKDGETLDLTALEFALLHLLIANNGQVVHRDRILDEVWGEGVYIEPRTIDKHMSLLRKKVEDDPQNPRFIVGVRSVGYKFVA